MNRRHALLALTGLLAGLRPESAEAEPIDGIRFSSWGAEPLTYLATPPYYLRHEELLALPLAPPAPNSAASTRAELDELLRLQSIRSASERAAIEQHLDYAPLCALFVSAAGRNLASSPRTRSLLEHVNLDGRYAVFQAKRCFERARPTQLEPRLHPCIPVPRHPAYPSAHATQGYLLGRVVGLLAPDVREPLEALGLQIAHEREIAGVHYPSDSVAGRALGDAVFTALQANAIFTREVDAAKSEWGKSAGPTR